MALKTTAPDQTQRRERGSALLVSLMVLVGLSLIGLGYVALSETEGAIAMNERNSGQTLHVAETGANMVVEWFQNPKWARDQELSPETVDAIRVVRRLTLPGGATYTGRYKQDGTRLFERPFRNTQDRFFGTETNPDILINDKTAPEFLAALNIALFNTDKDATPAANCGGCDNTQGGRITEIRVFAPPIDGGSVNTENGWADPNASGIPAATGFFEGGTRFGLASIRVTATKFNRPDCGHFVDGCRVLAERNVKMVIAEWPFPGPQGPIQSNANIATTGNYHIHWGKITSTLDTDLKRPYVSIPWYDAYDRAPFEHGYESAPGNIPANTANVWPLDAAVAKKSKNWLYELINRSYEDPWYQARARGHIIQMAGTDPVNQAHQYAYTNSTLDPTFQTCNPCGKGGGVAPGQSNLFQYQTKNLQPSHTNSLFPRVDYDFWKQVAISADGQDNIYYLRHVAKDTFRDRHGNVKSFEDWVNVAAPNTKSKPGFYFFDTVNSMNPQNNRGGILTPKVQMSGKGLQMQGFIYINTEEIAITGAGQLGTPGYYNMPGEVFRDLGYRQVDVDPGSSRYKQWTLRDPSLLLATPPQDCTVTDNSNCVTVLAGNNKFDYQDLPWSNGGTAPNKEFDVFVQQRATLTRDSAPTTLANEYFPVSWWPGCVPGKNGTAGVNCSEPHEPYLNFIYPAPGAPASAITVRWEAPASQTRRRKTNPTGVKPPTALPGCGGASQEDCTSNAHDEDGPLIQLSPILDGVLYNEGKFGSAGNADYFGSLLFERDVDAAGTPNIWFDEKLIKGDWPPGNFGFPRVYVTTHETDQ